MLHLCNQLGVCVALGLEDWIQLLSTAREHGWIPAGTSPPPVRLDAQGFNESEAWDGNYDRPRGQLVHRTDAKHLASALREALDAGALSQYSEEWVEYFLAFFRQSFAICADSRHLRAVSHAPNASTKRTGEIVKLRHFAQVQSL